MSNIIGSDPTGYFRVADHTGAMLVPQTTVSVGVSTDGHRRILEDVPLREWRIRRIGML